MIEVDVRVSRGGFSLDVAFSNTSSVTAIFGPSGAGKTMTLNLIAGLLRPDSGFIKVDGDTLVDVEAGAFVPAARRRIGLVFQDSNLFPHLSVKQNLLYGRWFAPRDAHRLAFQAVIETLGIGALLARAPASLSGGERQRVAIGRALLSCPRLLLFDEPLAALDMARKMEILPLLERVRDEFKIPIVYVSHAVEEVARLAHCVVIIEAGRVKFVGDPAKAFNRIETTPAKDRFDLSSVITAVVDEGPARHGLTRLNHPAGVIWVAGHPGAGSEARVVVKATDVILSRAKPEEMSIRSVLCGRIATVRSDGALATVELELDGNGSILATVTRGALEDLALAPGSRVFALFKSAGLDERAMGVRTR